MASANANHLPLTMLIYTDSKSFCEVSNPDICYIRGYINSISFSIYIQCIPGYSDIPGNELAERAAKESTSIAANSIHHVSLSRFLQVINDKIRDNPLTDERIARVCQHRKVKPLDGENKSRIKRTTCCLLGLDPVIIHL